MKRLSILILTAALINATGLLAQETVTVDGVTYEILQWGTVTPAEVSVIHRTGTATLPLEKLPAELRERFKYDPDKAAAYRAKREAQRKQAAEKAAAQAEAARMQAEAARLERERQWMEARQFQQDAKTRVMVEGRLMPRSAVRKWMGFYVGRINPKEDEEPGHAGVVLDLAEPTKDLKTVPPAMRLRPGLWKRTGEQIVFKGAIDPVLNGALVEVVGVELERVGDWIIVAIPREFTFEQWRRYRQEQADAELEQIKREE